MIKTWRNSSNRPYPGPPTAPETGPGQMIPYVPCKGCGTPTFSTGTGLCDDCWEIARRIRGWSLWKLIGFWRRVW